MTAPGFRYALLALDLDGTLLDPSGRVSQANLDAVRAAQAAGIRVVVCTGRGLVECQPVLDILAYTEPAVVAGGAIIACPVTRATLRRFPMNPGLVARIVDRIRARGHAALVLKDPHAAGYDYLVVADEHSAPIDPISMWWFHHLKIKARVVTSLDEDDHPEHTVRVGLVASGRETQALADDLRTAFAGETVMHHFPAVVPTAPTDDPDTAGPTALILELFDRSVSKWTAIEHLARGWGIDPSRIAAIGDQINDAPMIRGAGLGIAMGNAIPEVRAAAARTTLDNTRDGVAHAIGRILSGAW